MKRVRIKKWGKAHRVDDGSRKTWCGLTFAPADVRDPIPERGDCVGCTHEAERREAKALGGESPKSRLRIVDRRRVGGRARMRSNRAAWRARLRNRSRGRSAPKA